MSTQDPGVPVTQIISGSEASDYGIVTSEPEPRVGGARAGCGQMMTMIQMSGAVIDSCQAASQPPLL